MRQQFVYKYCIWNTVNAQIQIKRFIWLNQKILPMRKFLIKGKKKQQSVRFTCCLNLLSRKNGHLHHHHHIITSWHVHFLIIIWLRHLYFVCFFSVIKFVRLKRNIFILNFVGSQQQSKYSCVSDTFHKANLVEPKKKRETTKHNLFGVCNIFFSFVVRFDEGNQAYNRDTNTHKYRPTGE